MKLGSLFDGSGGFPLAGAMCGIEPVWASEVEPYPIAVTTSRFPNVKHLGSVTDINGAEIEPVDIITFGSPCQDISIAGQRAGLKHTSAGDDETTRSGLFIEAIRIIKEMREKTDGRYPTFAIWENVPGAFSSNKGEDFRIVLEEFCKVKDSNAYVPRPPKGKWRNAGSVLGNGWSIAWRVFDAQFWGVPQRRRRIYLVADFAGHRAGKILFERKGLRWYFAEGISPWQGTAATAQGCTGIYDPAIAIQGSMIGRKDKNGPQGDGVNEDVCFTLNTIDRHAVAVKVDKHLFENHSQDSRYKGPLDVCQMLAAQMGTGGNNQPFVVERSVYGFPLYFRPENTRCYEETDTTICNGTRAGFCNGVIAIDRAFFNQGKNALYAPQIYEDGMNPTLVARGPSAVAYEMTLSYIVRRLTPTECARLQGFPENWGHPDTYDDFTDEQENFWRKVRQTDDAIKGRQPKEYTKEQLIKWYNKLHTDSSEYKMWGNGIALPNALYVMEGIKEQDDERAK